MKFTTRSSCWRIKGSSSSTMIVFLLLLLSVTSCKGSMDLFYCATPVLLGGETTHYEYKFRLEATGVPTEVTADGRYVNKVIFASSPNEPPLENFTLTSGIPAPFNKFQQYDQSANYTGYMLSLEYTQHLAEPVDAILIDKFGPNTRKLTSDTKSATDQGQEHRKLNTIEAGRNYKALKADIGLGWYPSGKGDSISWTGTADKSYRIISSYEMAWTFLEGNYPFAGTHMKAIYDCSKTSSIYQDLTMDYGTNMLGLTDSDVYVNLSHLVNDDMNELQDLAYDNQTNELSLSSSNVTIDLSHLEKPPQELEWDSATMELGLSGSNDTVDLSPLAQDLNFDEDTNTLEISSSGSGGVDLSSFRIVALQASIDDLEANDDRRLVQEEEESVVEEEVVEEEPAGSNSAYPKPQRSRRVRGSEHKRPQQQDMTRTRQLKKGDGKVTYGGSATSGWTLISSGRLIGMTITANEALEKGSLRVNVVECSYLDALRPLGDSALDFLLLTASSGKRSQVVKFAQPVAVNAGEIICLDVSRSGDIKANDNAASLVLTLEQH